MLKKAVAAIWLYLPSIIQPFLGPLAVKMVFSAADAVSQLMRAQFEHTLPAGKYFFAGGKYL